MWTWEYRTETDGTQCLRVLTSPETPEIETALVLSSLTRAVLSTMVYQEYPLDGDSPHGSESSESSFGILFQRMWGFPNSN